MAIGEEPSRVVYMYNNTTNYIEVPAALLGSYCTGIGQLRDDVDEIDATT